MADTDEEARLQALSKLAGQPPPQAPQVPAQPQPALANDQSLLLQQLAEEKQRGENEKDKAKLLSLGTLIGQGVSGFGDALRSAATHGQTGVNGQYFDNLREGMNQKALQESEQRKRDIINNYTEKRQLAQDAFQDQQQHLAVQQASEARDPNSDISRSWQQAASQLVPGFDAKGKTAAQIQGVLPSLEKAAQFNFKQKEAERSQANSDRTFQAGQENLQEQRRSNDLQHQFNNNMATSQFGEKQREFDAKLDDKQGAKADKSLQDLTKNFDSFRGNKVVANAGEALRLVGNAKEILSQYPNLNDMPPEQYNQLLSEVGKIASGGVASEHTMKEMGANTLQSRASKFFSEVGNHPTGAQLGEFIQQNKNYLDGLEKSNRAVVDKYHTDVWNAYQKNLSPEDHEMFLKQHPELKQTEDKEKTHSHLGFETDE